MTPSRKKLVTGSVLLLGIGVVVVAGITFYPPLRERYWLSRLESEAEDERLEATRKLVELGSVRAIPLLIDAYEDAMNESAYEWRIDRYNSQITLLLMKEVSSLPTKQEIQNLRSYADAILEISMRAPERSRKLLTSCLSADRQIVRAMAASVLFRGTGHAREHVSQERILSIDRLIFDGERELPDIE